MQITSDKLKEMGCPNVIGIKNHATLVNEIAVAAFLIHYDSEDELKRTEWFQDAKAGAIIIICDCPAQMDIKGVYLRLFKIFDSNGKSYDFGKAYGVRDIL